MEIQLFNTLSRRVERFEPLEPGKVKFYACGPTVYNTAHIGNLRTYMFEDVLRRVLQSAGYTVQHVMNVTDVGHLESDADAGDDKLALAAKREHKSPWDIARVYEKEFFDDCAALHILPPMVVCRATEHIEIMQRFIQDLKQRNYTYEVDGNVYYRTGKFSHYGQLQGALQQCDEAHMRVKPDPRKQDPRDFVLWFSNSKFPNQIMKWDSPWGIGFPGWHIECSAMATHHLGERIDIHAGGVDHIPVHHANEIAQSEGVLGHKWVNMWLHGEFLVLAKDKMAKSGGNALTLKTLHERGFDPLHYRYLCLTVHYRKQLLFSWEALESAKRGFEALKNRVVSWRAASPLFATPCDLSAGFESIKTSGCKSTQWGGSDQNASGSHASSTRTGTENSSKQSYAVGFWAAVCNDLGTPTALAIVWEMAKDPALTPAEKLALVREFDQVLGLGVEKFARPHLEPELQNLVQQRERLRVEKRWAEADAVRDQLAQRGVQLQDTSEGPDWYLSYKDESFET